MSTSVEAHMQHMSLTEQQQQHDLIKLDEKSLAKGAQLHQSLPQQTTTLDKSQHPLHQYDLTSMSKFYEACMGKLKEHHPKWQTQAGADWTRATPIPHHLTVEQRLDWPNPFVIGEKQRVYEAFARLARESGEPMILMPNFDYGDLLNFERFLQALKQDGVNAIGKYKLYLNNKDMRKFECDLVCIHAKYGVILVEVKECDHLDSKRRSRARAQLNNARICFESMARLVAEAKGWTHSEAHVQITELIALPKVQERPVSPYQQQQQLLLQQQQLLLTPGGNQDVSASSTTSATTSSRGSRQLQYLVKSDLESSNEFAKWFAKYVVEPKQEQKKAAEADNKVNKFDEQALSWMVGLINCVRHNSIMPVVYPETDVFDIKAHHDKPKPTGQDALPGKPVDETKDKDAKDKDAKDPKDKDTKEEDEVKFEPAMNVHGEFFIAEHEAVRALAKAAVCSRDADKLRKAVCLQTLWLLLNDTQKKVSVVCSELNKAYYEAFFAHQRKLYNNLHNVRFYTDLQSCAAPEGATTLPPQQPMRKVDTETWLIDADGLNNGHGRPALLRDVVERVKTLTTAWVFTTKEDELLAHHRAELETAAIRIARLDTDLSGKMMHQKPHDEKLSSPWLTGKSLKFPLRLQADLLIVGDIIGVAQLRSLYKYLKSTSVTNNASHYQGDYQHHEQQPNGGDRYGNRRGGSMDYGGNGMHLPQQKQQQLNFNPTKKFKTVKFIRGTTVESVRTALKMHDCIQAQVVLVHVGDEDLFKTRSAAQTVERTRDLAHLVREYCPKSFVVLSTLMRRVSRTENATVAEVNKGIVAMCKQTPAANLYYMSNAHFEPEHHTHEGRSLINKGLRLYVENLLFMVDYFMIKNNKQN